MKTSELSEAKGWVYSPHTNRDALELALRAVRDFDVVAADVEHGRLWSIEDIESALRS